MEGGGLGAVRTRITSFTVSATALTAGRATMGPT